MRSPAERWSTLSMLLASVERCVEANARLDARWDLVERPKRRGRPRSNHAEITGAVVGARIDAASLQVSRELDRLTAELLMRDLARRREAAA